MEQTSLKKDPDGIKNCLEPFTCVDLLKWRKFRTLRREAIAKRKKKTVGNIVGAKFDSVYYQIKIESCIWIEL